MRHDGKLDASIRLFVLKGNADGSSFTVGRDAIFHKGGVGYGSPAIEVDAKGDITMVYRKLDRAAGDGQGARYLVWPVNSSEKPEGHKLAADEANLPCGSPCEKRGDHDTAGISLAPGGRVYVMQPYVKGDKSWGYAVNYVEP
jgi:hypothetical protein